MARLRTFLFPVSLANMACSLSRTVMLSLTPNTYEALDSNHAVYSSGGRPGSSGSGVIPGMPFYENPVYTGPRRLSNPNSFAGESDTDLVDGGKDESDTHGRRGAGRDGYLKPAAGDAFPANPSDKLPESTRSTASRRCMWWVVGGLALVVAAAALGLTASMAGGKTDGSSGSGDTALAASQSLALRVSELEEKMAMRDVRLTELEGQIAVLNATSGSAGAVALQAEATALRKQLEIAEMRAEATLADAQEAKEESAQAKAQVGAVQTMLDNAVLAFQSNVTAMTTKAEAAEETVSGALMTAQSAAVSLAELEAQLSATAEAVATVVSEGPVTQAQLANATASAKVQLPAMLQDLVEECEVYDVAFDFTLKVVTEGNVVCGVDGTKFLPEDGELGDQFGASVAVGTHGLVVVGAPNDDNNGVRSGSASLFRISGDGKSAQLIVKLVADDGAPNDRFGLSVAFGGDGLIVVGSPYHYDKGTDSGSAYVFRVNTTTGMPQLLAKVVPDDGTTHDLFGYSVAAGADSLVVVGSPFYGSGSAYLYFVGANETVFRLITKLVPDDGVPGGRFGRSIAIGDGRLVVIGAYGDNQKGSSSGSVYVYRVNAADTPELLTKLVAEDGEAGDKFGISVAIGGDDLVVAVGAHHDDDKGAQSGSVYLYRISTSGTAPMLIAKLVAEDGVAYDNFGYSVAVGGNGLVVVGAVNDATDKGSRSAGSAYSYRVPARGTQPLFITKLMADGGQADDNFGYSVAVGTYGVVIIGAVSGDGNVANSGSAYVF